MDTPSSRNSSYLIFAVGILAVVSLILGIVGLTKATKIEKEMKAKLGDYAVTDLAERVSKVEAMATTSRDEARNAATNTRAAVDRLRNEVSTALGDINNNLNRVAADARAAQEALASRAAPAHSSSPAGGSGAAPGTLAADGTYVIKSGDTLAKIGAQFGVSWQDIARANPGVDPNRLRVGQSIVIPKKP